MSRLLLNLSWDVKEFWEPYFKKLELDHFNYIHRDDNNNVTYLCSNPKWLEHYLKKSYPKIGAFEQKVSLSQYNYILWNGLDRNDPILIDSKEMLGVEYGLTLIKKEPDGYGFFNIGTKTSDPSIINTFVNRLELYENFVLAFQERLNTVLNAAKRLKLSANPTSKVDKYKRLGHQFGNLYLTERELQCVNYLALGKTAEEISLILNISKRTVETHVEHIKKKLDCYNQFRLGYLLGRMGIPAT